MCAAHGCFRNALAQTFRLSNRTPSATLLGLDFLVPAVARAQIRSFATTKPRSSAPPSQDTLDGAALYLYPPRLLKEPLELRIELPDSHARRDIQSWLAALDPFLPSHLRQQPPLVPDNARTATSIDIPWLLCDAQKASHDILSHMGLIEGRWDTVVWIIKKLVGDHPQILDPPAQLEPLGNIVWPEDGFRSLHALTNNPLAAHRVPPSRTLQHGLDKLTSRPDTIDLEHVVVKQALGQVWQTLGNMILSAIEEGNPGESNLMAHVLEIIAYLHHAGLIPDSVYTPKAPKDGLALRQPPTLHLLSSTILTALSDATWKAHETSVKVAQERMNASYFLGHEIPGSRYKIRVTEVTPELWLELILWSCLHGGWVLDGAAILERMLTQQTEYPWGVISWRELLDANSEDLSLLSREWSLFRRRQEASSQAEARTRTQRTISSEVVTAFVDGLINIMRVGVGDRGAHPEHIVGHIKRLKQLLDRSSLSLGTATWDSVMIRLLESGGVVPEKRPELLLKIAGIASNFGSEVASANLPSRSTLADTALPYFFEPSTTSLSLLHQAMRFFVENGDMSGAMTALTSLQRYTDHNKQKSLQKFFEALKGVQLRKDEPFASKIPPIDFPAFEPQIPVPLLAKVLDLAADTGMHDLGRWLLFSKELDGPLITREMYSHPHMAASIIRFGTMAGESDLILEIVERTGYWSSKNHVQRLPDELFSALFISQIRLHRWESVRSMQTYIIEHRGYHPPLSVLASFAAEVLRLFRENEGQQSKVRDCFGDLLFAWEEIIMSRMQSELYCILGMLSSVSQDLQTFCSQFLAFSTRHAITVPSDDFNRILGGVLDGFGSMKGMQLVQMWCNKPLNAFEPYRAPGGLPTMSRSRKSKGKDYESRPENIEIVQSSGARLILQGRVICNRQTVWAILRKVRQEQDQRQDKGTLLTSKKRAEVRETLRWAASLLYYLGIDYEDIIRDMGSLAELAELEAPLSQSFTGLPE